MDLERPFGERVVITPRRFPLVFRNAAPMEGHYAMMGMAAVIDNYPLYAEAMNEKGLCMAGLNFPENAFYPAQADPAKVNLSPFELIPFLLGKCGSLSEVRDILAEIRPIHVPFSAEIPLTPLHWLIADASGSLVLESVREGLRVYENPTGVLTNNPPFDFHLANLCHYDHLTPASAQGSFCAQLGLKPFGMGLGGVGLPGDYSSASRFVKAVWLRQNMVWGEDESTDITQVFHLLSAVAPPKGSVLTPKGEYHFTTYSCCMDADDGIYYYATAFDRQIAAVRMSSAELEGQRLIVY